MTWRKVSQGVTTARPEAVLALYYFHLSDGHEVMIAQDALSGRIMLNQYIQVRDHAGKLVHQLSFHDAVMKE